MPDTPQPPPPSYPSVEQAIAQARLHLADDPALADLFARCFRNTLDTTITLLDDGTTFVVTGDIPAMWLRDSSAQVYPYVSIAADDPAMQRLLRGVIWRQAEYINIDPYANAFNLEPNGAGHKGDRPPSGPWVWERKFELDSLCYPIWLCNAYWQATADHTVFDVRVHKMLQRIIDVMGVEQYHDTRSPYTFRRPRALKRTDTLPNRGRGAPTNPTGMVWSGFRPSDDACTYGYLIPSNMFAVVVLGMVENLAMTIYADVLLAQRAATLRAEIDHGIQTYGTVEHPQYGRIYAYETDGLGHYNLMDDANIPSLLSIPYVGYTSRTDPMYLRTRRYVLGPDNPYYFRGRAASGIGSPHTPAHYIWPLALAMQGLTASEASERETMVRVLSATTAGTGYMHESFNANDPARFTRPWFAWANSLFATLVLRWLADRQTTAATQSSA
jgi:meiotically up-regulated gene 157 (Mug157) protein